MEPDAGRGVQGGVRNLNWTVIALIGGLVLLVLLVAYFASRGNADQDKLTSPNVTASSETSRDKLCASSTTYDLIKRDLFRRAAQVRGSDQGAYDQISSSAVVRMENPVMEGEDSSTGAVRCSGSLSLDLPPGVAVVGGRRTLAANVDYSVRQAADGSGPVVLLSNADAIITPLATLSRVAAPAVEPSAVPDDNQTMATEEEEEPAPAPASPTAPEPTRQSSARPSFNCASARTRGEIAVCADAQLAALDRQMAGQYSRAIAGASPEQRAILQRTRDRFLGYRDRCQNNSCIGDAYVGRMREIRDIMNGRWQPPR